MTNASYIPTVPPPSPSLSPRRPRRAAIPLAYVHGSASATGSPDSGQIPQLGTPAPLQKLSLSRILSGSRRRPFHAVPGSPHHASLSSPHPALLTSVPRLKSGSKRVDMSSIAAFSVANGHSVPGRTAPVLVRRANGTSPIFILTEPQTRSCPSRIQPGPGITQISWPPLEARRDIPRATPPSAHSSQCAGLQAKFI